MQSAYDRIQYYEFNDKEIAVLLAKLKAVFAAEKRIKLAILFGSLTRRNYTRDIDICIHASPALRFNELLDLNAQIELELGVPVDLMELSCLPSSLRANILRSGIPIKGTKALQHQLLKQLP
jgi:predicted nucleotidyltransferase